MAWVGSLSRTLRRTVCYSGRVQFLFALFSCRVASFRVPHSGVFREVKAIKPYGAFVEIRGMSGLLHISQISFDRVEDLPSILDIGMTVKCMIIDHDKVGRGCRSMDGCFEILDP